MRSGEERGGRLIFSISSAPTGAGTGRGYRMGNRSRSSLRERIEQSDLLRSGAGRAEDQLKITKFKSVGEKATVIKCGFRETEAEKGGSLG